MTGRLDLDAKVTTAVLLSLRKSRVGILHDTPYVTHRSLDLNGNVANAKLTSYRLLDQRHCVARAKDYVQVDS